jgi:hypothetical protein
MPLSDANVLITGGTGSFGKKFVEIVLATCRPKKLIDCTTTAEAAKRLGATLYIAYLPSPLELYVLLPKAADRRNRCGQSACEHDSRGEFDFEGGGFVSTSRRSLAEARW